jgi:hypothetical protein
MADNFLAAASLFHKFESRISKSETIFNFEALKSKTPVSSRGCLEHWGFCHSILFRASNFVLRIYLVPFPPLREKSNFGCGTSRAAFLLEEAGVNRFRQLLHVGKLRRCQTSPLLLQSPRLVGYVPNVFGLAGTNKEF